MTEASQSQKSVDLELGKDAAVALTIKVGGLVLVYLVQVFLARWMGRSEYGIYEYVIAWSVLLAIPAGLGLPRIALRLIPEYRVKQEWGLMRGLFRGSWLMTLGVGLLFTAAGAGIILLLNNYRSSFIYGIPLLLGMVLVPLQALIQLQQETSRGMGDVTLAFAPSLIMWPVLTLCGAFLFIETQHSLSSLPAIEVAIGSLFLVVVFQWLLLQQKIRKDVEPASPVYAYREWLGISLVLLIQRAFLIVLDQTDIIMVGSLAGSDSAGVYNAAAKTALWVKFVLEMLNWVVAPIFATLYTQGDMKGLQRVVSKITVWIFWPSIVISVLLLTFTQPVLSIFGPGFEPANLSLKVLVIGRLVDALCGSVGSLMVMTGHQNKSLPVFITCALINLVGNAIAIPYFGILGAAIATTFTMVVWNVWLSILVTKYLGIRTWIFYSLFNRENESVNN